MNEDDTFERLRRPTKPEISRTLKNIPHDEMNFKERLQFIKDQGWGVGEYLTATPDEDE